MSSVFLSHNHADKPFVRRLVRDLQASGIRVWFDEAELMLGDSLIEKIREGIDAMEYLGVVLSPNSIQSRWVQHEVDVAMNQEIRGKRIKVLPLVFADCKLPGFLEGKFFADFRDEARYEEEFSKILVRVRGKETIVRLRTHQARFTHNKTRYYYFINIVNIGNKPIEVTHIWYEDIDNHIPIKNTLRTLPVRLEVSQPWETWIELSELPEEYRERAFHMFRIRLSTGEHFSSRKGEGVPPYGVVPGGEDITDVESKE